MSSELREKEKGLLFECVLIMLHPIVSFCLRRSVKIQDVIEAVKICYIQATERIIIESNGTPSVSRLSVMTGIHRRDVSRLYQAKPEPSRAPDLLSRILNQWEQDTRFTTSSGKPRVLSITSEQSEFSELLRSVSNELTQYPVLKELERLDLVERTATGARLKKPAYVPSEDLKEAAQLMADDAHDLMVAVEENVADLHPVPNYHIKTEFDNVIQSAVPEVREWLLKQGTLLHKKARGFLSSVDADINQKYTDEDAGVRVVIGGYSRITGTHS